MDAARILTVSHAVSFRDMDTMSLGSPERLETLISARCARDIGSAAWDGGLITRTKKRDRYDGGTIYTFEAAFVPKGCVVITKEELERLQLIEERWNNYD